MAELRLPSLDRIPVRQSSMSKTRVTRGDCEADAWMPAHIKYSFYTAHSRALTASNACSSKADDDHVLTILLRFGRLRTIQDVTIQDRISPDRLTCGEFNVRFAASCTGVQLNWNA